MKIRGRVWKFGDGVNTDLILPGRYLDLTDPEEMARHVMESLDHDFPMKVERGDIIVAGRGFGSGSSREHAALALKHAGVSAIIAESIARIFFRNAINVGLPALECPGITDIVEEGETLEIDLEGGVAYNPERGRRIKFKPLPEFLLNILRAGGLVPYTRGRS
ncbi:3-isopropylmalate dehydratase [Candidatus Bathyarchaeota archaeon]|nr:MAG: 3-isopropylmalate dehydratase [Candidatus Bathyarchaeota archaeon]